MNESRNASKGQRNDAATADAQDKVEHPLSHFENPAEVIADTALTRSEKVQAVETMEQDARQMAVAAGEGMTGGEPARLDDVLTAKDALDLPPFNLAVAVVVQTLRGKLPQYEGTEAHTLISNAVEALETACAALRTGG